jgi:hypothetical protein
MGLLYRLGITLHYTIHTIGNEIFMTLQLAKQLLQEILYWSDHFTGKKRMCN